MNKKKTTEEFIEEIKKLLPDSDLDFSETVYVNKRTKVKLICPIHGEFEKLPTNILKGQGCPKCGWNRINDSRRVTTEEFINRSKQVHGNRYNYDKTIFIGVPQLSAPPIIYNILSIKICRQPKGKTEYP